MFQPFVSHSLRAGLLPALLFAITVPACQVTSGEDPSAPATAPAPSSSTRSAPPACDPSRQFCGDTPPVPVDPTTIVVAPVGPHGQRLAKVQPAEALLGRYREAPEADAPAAVTAPAVPEDVLRRQALYLENVRELARTHAGDELARRKVELKRRLLPPSAEAPSR